MSYYEELVYKYGFLDDYQRPELDELTVGFSGIDPPLKGEDIELDHEELNGLLGGDENGHYHLTKDLWLKVIALLENKDFDGGFASTSEEEYAMNEEYWFDGGEATTTDDEYNENADSWQDGGNADD